MCGFPLPSTGLLLCYTGTPMGIAVFYYKGRGRGKPGNEATSGLVIVMMFQIRVSVLRRRARQ